MNDTFSKYKIKSIINLYIYKEIMMTKKLFEKDNLEAISIIMHENEGNTFKTIKGILTEVDKRIDINYK